MSRYKRIIGDTLRSHARPAQEVETRIAAKVLNRMLDLGRPESVRAPEDQVNRAALRPPASVHQSNNQDHHHAGLGLMTPD
ncbi:hypothetical protein GGE65_008316 [Skermanella aerolata]